MALAFTTGMTSIDPADSVTGWSAFKITSGGASPSVVQDVDTYREGSACNSLKPTQNKDCGIVYDYYGQNGNTVLNMSTSGNEVLSIWIKSTAPAQILTRVNAGICFIVTAVDADPTSANSWAKWYVAGSDVNPGDWQLFLIDTRKTPSATNGGFSHPTDMATVYRIGITAFAANVIVAKTENIFIDAMWYGRPIYKLTGDGALTADWADFLSDSVTNENGLIQDVNGALEMSCGAQIGDDAQTATTTFDDDTNQNVNWKRHIYDTGSGIVDALTYSDYYKFIGQGAASFNTSITLGNVVGSDSGIVGGTLRSLDPVNVPVIVDFDTDQAHISVMNWYGVNWQGITGSFKIGNNSAYDVYSNQFLGCSQIDPVGDCVIRNCNFINTADVDSALLWNENIDIANCNFIANTVGAGIEHPSAAGTPYTYTSLLFSGNANDVLNSATAITITKAGTPVSDPTSSEGAGVTFQGSVTINITVQDEATDPVVSALAIVRAMDDNSEIMNEDTIAGGVAVQVYTGSTPRDVKIWIRKASPGDTKYIAYSTLGQLSGSTFDLLATLKEDPNNISV